MGSFFRGVPSDAWWGVAMAMYSLLEYKLPRIQNVRARSFWEGVFNILGRVFPRLQQKLGTPTFDNNTKLELPDDGPTKPTIRLPVVIAFFGTVAMGAGLTILLSGCAHGIDGMRQSLVNIEVVNEGAVHVLSQWDHDHQLSIVANAVATGHPKDAPSLLAEYRAKRRPVEVTQALVASLLGRMHVALEVGNGAAAAALLNQLGPAVNDFTSAAQQLTGMAGTAPVGTDGGAK